MLDPLVTAITLVPCNVPAQIILSGRGEPQLVPAHSIFLN